jgi:hypothetical protein
MSTASIETPGMATLLVTPDQLRVYVAMAMAEKKYRVAAKLIWPFLKQNAWTDKIWDNLEKYQYNCIMGHASASKTFTCAAFYLLKWWESPHNTAFIVTSDTIASMNRRIWSDIKTLWGKSRIPMPGELIDSRHIIRISNLDDKNAIAAVAAESDDAQSKIQGVHTENIIVLIDEADNKFSRSVWGAISNLGASGNLHVTALANPVDRNGDFGSRCEPEDGWSSIDPENDMEWEGCTGWHVLRLDGMKSPNLVAGEDLYPFLLTNKGVADIRREKGENSLEWWCYVRAWYPPEGTSNCIFTPDILARTSKKLVWNTVTEKIAACDPAFEGGDDCALVIGCMGRLADDPSKLGVRVEKLVKIKRQKPSVPITFDFGSQIVNILREEKIKPAHFGIDSTGNALGLSDYIKHTFSPAIHAISFGGKPSRMKLTAEDTQIASSRFDRFVSELWYSAREWMRLGLIEMAVQSRELQRQLEARTYELLPNSAKIRIETKTEMKDRGLPSPDFGDAVSILIHVAKISLNSSLPSIGTAKARIKDRLSALRKKEFSYRADYQAKHQSPADDQDYQVSQPYRDIGR